VKKKKKKTKTPLRIDQGEKKGGPQLKPKTISGSGGVGVNEFEGNKRSGRLPALQWGIK